MDHIKHGDVQLFVRYMNVEVVWVCVTADAVLSRTREVLNKMRDHDTALDIAIGPDGMRETVFALLSGRCGCAGDSLFLG